MASDIIRIQLPEKFPGALQHKVFTLEYQHIKPKTKR